MKMFSLSKVSRPSSKTWFFPINWASCPSGEEMISMAWGAVTASHTTTASLFGVYCFGRVFPVAFPLPGANGDSVRLLRVLDGTAFSRQWQIILNIHWTFIEHSLNIHWTSAIHKLINQKHITSIHADRRLNALKELNQSGLQPTLIERKTASTPT